MNRKAVPAVLLPFPEAVNLLKKGGVEFCETVVVGSEKEAFDAACRLGFPIFVKDVSLPTGATAVHKLKAGLVAKVDSQESFALAYRNVESSHFTLAKKGVLERKISVAVQKESSGVECIIGARRDSSFGPVVVFGSGGVFAEELDDVALCLCPITKREAEGMIGETRAYKRTFKHNGPNEHPLLQKLAAVIVKVSNLITSHPELLELDINPVFIDISAGKVGAVDVRAVAARAAAKPAATAKKLKKKKPATERGKRTAAADWKPATIASFFSPTSIAVVGASRDKESVGQSIMRNLTIGCVHRCEYCRPFLGKIFAVNPFASEVLGIRCYPSILGIPEAVDMAIIAIPHQFVLKAVEECVKKRVKAVIIISAGFGEFNKDGRRLQAKVVERLERAKIPLLGPNCLGIIRPKANLNASFAPSTPPAGGIAFVSQSGALADSVIDWSIQARYGFSALISYGNKAMLDCYDFFNFLANDEETKAVALYVEGVNGGREFFEKLKSLAVKKPVVLLKGGRTASGVVAAATHTASLAGDAKVFEAAIKQSGAFLVDTVEELFDIAKVLSEQPVCKGNGVAVITNGGGCGVICSDYCDELGVNLPQLQKGVLKAFEKSGLMHPAYSRMNPLDIIGDALADRYGLAINALLKEPYIHGLIVIQTLQAMTNPVLNAKVIVEAHKQFPSKPILSCFMGGRFSKKGMHYLDNMRIPDFNDVRKAVVAVKALIERGEFLARLNSSASTTAAAVAKAAKEKIGIRKRYGRLK